VSKATDQRVELPLANVEVPMFQHRAKCGKCGGKRVDVRPNWKERPPMPTKLKVDG
jgi:hypothetical protein